MTVSGVVSAGVDGVVAAQRVKRSLGAPGAADRVAGLDRLVGLAARLLSATSSHVSLQSSVQTVVAGRGLAVAGSETALGDSLCTLTVAAGAPLAVADAAADERVRALPPVRSGEVGSYLGVPLHSPDGDTYGALCVFDAAPRAWTDADVALLEELGGVVAVELELAVLSAKYESSRVRWDVALEAAGVGSFDWSLEPDRVDWDERLQAMFGYSPGEYVPSSREAFSRVHPEDLPALEHAVAGAVASAGEYYVEYRVQLPDGRQRWFGTRGRAHGADGRVTSVSGVCQDVTEVRGARERAAGILEAMATGFMSVDRDWRVTYLNTMGSWVVGLTAAEVVGRPLWDVFPDLEHSEFGDEYRRAVADDVTVEFESFYERLQRWFEVRAVPDAGGLAVYFLDVTQRRGDQERARVEKERAEDALARLELLAAVSVELAASGSDTDTAVARLAQLVVPALGDWCIVTLFDDDENVCGFGAWHAEPDLRELVQTYAEHRFDSIGPYAPVQIARQSQEVVVLDAGAAARAVQMLASPVAVDALLRLAPTSAVVVPLLARGHVVGTLSVCGTGARAPLGPDGVMLAREVAARAALALDNARLYSAQRNLAEALQRSLLTEPPEPDHGEIVVRYVPAASSASVGGDWFDSFLQADGATMLVIGDVVGHDDQAAAAMGQVRGLLRGIAWDSGASPGSVLSRLDRAMRGLQVETTATAVVARLEQTPDERERGMTRLRWSNAGHPPPMVLHPDRAVAVLAGVAPDLLLGIVPDTPRVESEVVLDRGATVLLYTDGLVERRGEDLDVGLARLRDTLAELADLPLTNLCDALLQRLAGDADDDVALIAVRLHRQDRPRPAEAGPRRVPPGVPPVPAG